MTPYSGWHDAMSAQAKVLEFYQSAMGGRYLMGFFADMNMKHTAMARMDPHRLADIQYAMIKTAEPIWVSDEAARLVDHARHTFEPEPVLASDPFVECGFALLAEPMIVHDAPITERNPGRSPTGEIPVRAVAWWPNHNEDRTEGCFWISYFVHVDDEAALGASRFDPAEQEELRRFMPLALMHQFQWSWGSAPWDANDKQSWDNLVDEDVEATAVRGREQIQLIQTLWRIGSQYVRVPERPQRQIRRSAARHGVERTETVTVVRLRRTPPPKHDQDPSGRHLTVRHMVEGYWGRRHAREGIRQVWVNPYPRGDESLPWKDPTDRVYDFRR